MNNLTPTCWGRHLRTRPEGIVAKLTQRIAAKEERGTPASSVNSDEARAANSDIIRRSRGARLALPMCIYHVPLEYSGDRVVKGPKSVITGWEVQPLAINTGVNVPWWDIE